MPEAIKCPYCKEPVAVIHGKLAAHTTGRFALGCVGSGETAVTARELNSAHEQLRKKMEWRRRRRG